MAKVLAVILLKEKVFELIKQKPGLTADEIAEATESSEGEVASQLNELCHSGLIECWPHSHSVGNVFRAEYRPL